MNSDSRKTHAVPTTTATSTRSISPPKRFLDFPSQISPKKASPLSPPIPSSPTSPSLTSPGKLKTSPELSTPPKLIRIPKIVLTPVDVCQVTGEPNQTSSTEKPNFVLPPPPPLIRMPIGTRKEKRSLAAALDEEEEKDDNKPTTVEPLKKRTRGGGGVVDKSSETSSSGVTPTTPRKIIQEIFGPDKSKKSKGKGRKKKRAGAVTPKKKVPVVSENIESAAAVTEEDQGEDDGKALEEDNPLEEEVIDAEVDDTGLDDKKEECLDKINEDIYNEVEEKDTIVDNQPIEGENSSSSKLLLEKECVEEVKNGDEGGESAHPGLDEVDNSLFSKEKHEEKLEEGTETTEVTNAETEAECPSESKSQVDEVDAEPEVHPEVVPSFQTSRRKAKQVAKEKLKRLSQNDEAEASNGSRTEKKEQKEISSNASDSERVGAASIRSRRSTTEGSSKSSSSTNQGDFESTVSSCGGNYSNKHLMIDRQRLNPTPLSLISEDDYNDGKEPQDAISVSDMQEQKDSDLDSTYSWKPVRAAAAAALEQVTKKQGSGSTGLPGDAETKAAAAAERRARKVMRHRGRSRRTLQFKSSKSKQYTRGRQNRYRAQPTIANVVYNHGYYFQAGDIVNVELTDGSLMYGQIKGILIDHKGETSAGIRWLSPKHTLYGQVEFHPRNYSIRHDLPERLIKIEYVNFVMHLNLDYFSGHPSYRKIEKQAVFTRLGRYMYKNRLVNESDEDSFSDDENKNSSSSATSSSKKNLEKKTKEKRIDDDNDNTSNYSTDIEEIFEEKKDSSGPTERVPDAEAEKEGDKEKMDFETALMKEMVCNEVLDDNDDDDDEVTEIQNQSDSVTA